MKSRTLSRKSLKVRLNFVGIDSKTFKINYKPGILPSIGIRLRVEQRENNSLGRGLFRHKTP